MKTFLLLIYSLALTCAAGGAQEENKSKKPAPKAKQVQSTQHAARPVAHHVAISLGDGRTIEAKGSQEGVDTRQLLMQTQHDPMGAGAAQKMKGERKGSQQASPRSGQRQAASNTYEAGRDAKLDKPTFGERFMMGLKKSPRKSQKAQDAYAAPASVREGRPPTPVVRGQGKLEGGKKKTEKFSPTPNPR